MQFRHLTIRARLTLAFSTLTLLVVMVCGLSLKALSDADGRFVGYVDGVNARAVTANTVRTAVDRRAIAARNLVLLTRPADLAAEKAEVLRAHQDVGTHLAALNRMILEAVDGTEQGRALVAEIGRVERDYGPVALDIVDLALKGRHDEAIVKMNEQCRPLLAALITASQAYATYTSDRAQGLTADAAQAFRTQRTVMVAACLMAVLLAVVAGVLIVRSLTRCLGAEPAALERAASNVASGNLTPIAGASRASAGSVMASLGSMQARLATIVGEVRDTSDSIATGSAQIASGNADLSQRTEEQASALQQTAATMDELGTTVHNNADNARQANLLAQGASEIASRGGAVVARVVETMHGIDDSSRRIADIISVIDGIAFQTNILALNAAVEAARAGEQGRGFAVVASEVRSLAQRSAAAAKEIKSLIEESVGRVRAGTLLVGDAGTTMTEIVTAIRNVTDIVAGISTASAEQSTGVSQVGQSIAQMDQVTQQNAALVEQSAAAAESLKNEAGRLVTAVAAFQLH